MIITYYNNNLFTEPWKQMFVDDIFSSDESFRGRSPIPGATWERRSLKRTGVLSDEHIGGVNGLRPHVFQTPTAGSDRSRPFPATVSSPRASVALQAGEAPGYCKATVDSRRPTAHRWDLGTKQSARGRGQQEANPSAPVVPPLKVSGPCEPTPVPPSEKVQLEP